MCLLTYNVGLNIKYVVGIHGRWLFEVMGWCLADANAIGISGW